MSEKSYKAALLAGKCPSCHEGAIFKYPYTNVAHFAEMNPNCPVCGASFEREPGFYFGAMYITYGINVSILIGVGLFVYYIVDLPDTVSIIIIAAMSVLITPFSFRVSRVLWLYWFGGIDYKPRQV